jgi:hypothetical protein
LAPANCFKIRKVLIRKYDLGFQKHIMKKLFIPLFCLLLSAGTQALAQTTPATTAPANGPVFKYEGGDTYDFGIIKRGPVAYHTFSFTNTGTTPIIITDVTPSCGCTNVEWIKTPVLPGQKGFVSLGLKTLEQNGVFNKEVYIRSNAITPHGEKRYTLYIKGDARDNAAESKDQKEKK